MREYKHASRVSTSGTEMGHSEAFFRHEVVHQVSHEMHKAEFPDQQDLPPPTGTSNDHDYDYRLHINSHNTAVVISRLLALAILTGWVTTDVVESNS